MAKYLVDTNILIDHLKGIRSLNQVLIEQFSEETEITPMISSISELEVLSGREMVDKKKKEVALGLLSTLNRLSVDEVILLSAEIRRKYQKSIPDAIIAATAIENNLILISRDAKAFKGIKELMVKIVI